VFSINGEIMKVYEPNFKRLDELTEEGYLRKVISPCKKLMLYNYTDKTTYDKKWSKHTLNSRGTVYEIETGKVVARAFPKFFNFGELQPVKQKTILKSTSFEAFEKMDGSLGIVYFYDGEWRVNTRGSFTSDQAVKGKEMLDDLNNCELLPTRTYLVEIIYPENRIILDYGEMETLTLLAVYNTENGQEDNFDFAGKYTGFTIAPSSKFNTISELMKHMETLDHTDEGYVVRLADGYRVKFKSKEYLRLARIMSNMSPLAFWEKLDEKGVIDRKFLEELPEEFRDECDEMADQIETRYVDVKGEIYCDFNEILNCAKEEKVLDYEIRKYMGLYIKDMNVPHAGAMFSMLLENDAAVDKYIKKTIRPTGNIIK
jgi:RNA ligase